MGGIGWRIEAISKYNGGGGKRTERGERSTGVRDRRVEREGRVSDATYNHSF